MKLLLDLILLAIIALGVWRGYKSGIISGVIGLAAIIACVYVANIFAGAYSEEFVGMLEPFASGVVDSMVSSTVSNDPEDVEKAVVQLTNAEKEDVYSVSFAALRRLGLCKEVSDEMAQDVSGKVKMVNQEMNDQITTLLCHKITFAVVFFIAFILAGILCAVIGNVLDLRFGLPGAEKINNIGGAVLGGIKAFLIVLFIGCVCRYAGIVIGEERIVSTVILESVINKNIIASSVGI